MNYNQISDHLLNIGYSVSLKQSDNTGYLEVIRYIEGKKLSLIHFLVDELRGLPDFLIANHQEFGNLAHVMPTTCGNFGSVCIGDRDSISVNYERPELAFEESLRRYIDLLEKLITDSDWNEKELLREFYSNWLAICDASNEDFICAANGDLEEIKILSPVPGSKIGFEAKYLGITSSASALADFSYVAQQGKNRSTAGDGFLIPLNKLIPAPSAKDGVVEWYLRTIGENAIPKAFTQKKGRKFWLIFNAETPSGRTWFGLRLSYSGHGKKTLPKSKDRLLNWSLEPIGVTIFNKDRLMPRSGANIDLGNKSVLVIGCGSVGGELVFKLGAAGVGKIMLCDPDTYSVDNIYRHVLSDRLIGCNKALALQISLESKFPWITTRFSTKKLLDLRDRDYLNSFSLIVIAIGSPTHERLFHDFIIENNINTPVINTWLEGYGIGGHAIVDIRNTRGCLRCAYVDMNSGGRGLSSNLNFLEPNQDLTVNHAGCGELFLPYSAISAAQTALIAANLAVDTLLGKINVSSKVSWKGDSEEVVSHGYSVTHRYTAFDNSLQVMPLYNEECDLCHE